MLPFTRNVWGPRKLLFGRKWALFFPHGKAGGGVKLTTYVHLFLRLRMTGGVLRLPHRPSWRTPEQLAFVFYNSDSGPKFSECVSWLKYKRKLIHIESSVLSFQRPVHCTYIETYLWQKPIESNKLSLAYRQFFWTNTFIYDYSVAH